MDHDEKQIQQDITKIMQGPCAEALQQSIMAQSLMEQNKDKKAQKMHEENVVVSASMVERCLSQQYCATEYDNYVETVQGIAGDLVAEHGEEKMRVEGPEGYMRDDQKATISGVIYTMGHCLKSQFPAIFPHADSMQ